MLDSFLTQILKIIIALDVIAALVYIVLTALVLPAKKKRYSDEVGIPGIVPLMTQSLAHATPTGVWLQRSTLPTEGPSSKLDTPQKERSLEEELDRINRSLDDLMNTGLTEA